MEPIDYLRIFRRRWGTILLVCLLGGAFAFFTTPSRPVHRTLTYQATTTLILSPNAPSGTPSLAQAALFVTSGDIPKLVATQLNYKGSAASLASEVSAKADSTVNDLSITATVTDPVAATKVADTFAAALMVSFNGQAEAAYQQQVADVQKRIDQLNGQIGAMDAHIAATTPPSAPAGPPVTVDPVTAAQRDALVNQYRLAYDQFQQLAAQGAPTPAFTVLQKATASRVTDHSFRAPSSKWARLVIGLIAGLILGAGLILLLERIDLRIRTKDQAEDAFGYPVIAEIPALPRGRRRRKELVTVSKPGSPFAESHRILRTLLLFSPSTEVADKVTAQGNGSATAAPSSARSVERQTILVISPGPSEGKTTTVAHLAVAFAEAGRSVLVLSCDFRRPRVHQMFGLADGPGLTDVLSTPGLTLADVVVPTAVRGVSLVHSGRFVANPAELIAAGTDFLDDAALLADIVLVDTAPLLVANDASELMPKVDSVVVVARAGKTTRGSAQRAAEVLNRVGARVVGLVLTAASEAPTNRRYYYYRYYIRQDGLLGWRRVLRRSRKTPDPGLPVRVEPKPRPVVPKREDEPASVGGTANGAGAANGAAGAGAADGAAGVGAANGAGGVNV